MWKEFVKGIYGLLYYLGKTPPTAAEIDSEFDRLAKERAEIDATRSRCDCLVIAGGKLVACNSNVREIDCESIGDTYPGLNGIPRPLGSCKNIPRG